MLRSRGPVQEAEEQAKSRVKRDKEAVVETDLHVMVLLTQGPLSHWQRQTRAKEASTWANHVFFQCQNRHKATATCFAKIMVWGT